jgi:hypothetical protein
MKVETSRRGCETLGYLQTPMSRSFEDAGGTLRSDLIGTLAVVCGKSDSLVRRKALISLREADVLAFGGTTRLTTCGTPLSAGSNAAVGGPTLVGGCLRGLEASYAVERSGRAAVRSPRGYAGGQKCLRVGCNGLMDLAWHEECLRILCNGLRVSHGKQRGRDA